MLNRELDIHSLYDLLYYFPYKYIDRSKVFKVSELNGQMQHIQLLGEIRSFEEMGEGASRRLVAHFTDGTAFVRAAAGSKLMPFRAAIQIKPAQGSPKKRGKATLSLSHTTDK